MGHPCVSTPVEFCEGCRWRTLDVLRASGGGVGESLADAFQCFPWRKLHWVVRVGLISETGRELTSIFWD